MTEFIDEEIAENEQGLPAFLRDPRGVIQRRWPWMLAGLILGLIVVGVFIAGLQPTYQATAKVLIKRQRIPEKLVAPTVEEDTFQVINGLLSEVLSREHLAGIIRDENLYPELVEAQPLDEVIEVMRKNIEVTPEQGLQMGRFNEARIVAISFEDTAPKKAANVANALAKNLTERSLKNRSEQARITTEFLRRELMRVEAALQEENGKIADFQERYRGELPDELETTLRRLERLQDQRHSLAIQISDGESRLASLMVSMQSDQHNALPSPDARLAQLRAELTEAKSRYTDKYPTVISLQAQITALEKDLGIEASDTPSPSVDRSRLVQATQGQIDVLRNQLREVEQEISILDGRVTRIPSREEELSALEQKRDVFNENYREALQKVKGAELAQDLELAQQGARLSIVDPARPPLKTSGKRLKYAFAGVVASIGLGILIGFLLELIDPVVLTSDQLERFYGKASLGSIPRI